MHTIIRHSSGSLLSDRITNKYNDGILTPAQRYGDGGSDTLSIPNAQSFGQECTWPRLSLRSCDGQVGAILLPGAGSGLRERTFVEGTGARTPSTAGSASLRLPRAMAGTGPRSIGLRGRYAGAFETLGNVRLGHTVAPQSGTRRMSGIRRMCQGLFQVVIQHLLVLLGGLERWYDGRGYDSGASSSRLLLTGIVVASGWSALVSLLLAISPETSLRGLLFWLMGDFSFVDRPWPILVVSAAGTSLALLMARTLNVLGTGDWQAALLGIEVRRVRAFIYALSALLTSVAVTTAGVVGLVGPSCALCPPRFSVSSKRVPARRCGGACSCRRHHGLGRAGATAVTGRGHYCRGGRAGVPVPAAPEPAQQHVGLAPAGQVRPAPLHQPDKRRLVTGTNGVSNAYHGLLEILECRQAKRVLRLDREIEIGILLRHSSGNLQLRVEGRAGKPREARLSIIPSRRARDPRRAARGSLTRMPRQPATGQSFP